MNAIDLANYKHTHAALLSRAESAEAERDALRAQLEATTRPLEFTEAEKAAAWKPESSAFALWGHGSDNGHHAWQLADNFLTALLANRREPVPALRLDREEIATVISANVWPDSFTFKKLCREPQQLLLNAADAVIALYKSVPALGVTDAQVEALFRKAALFFGRDNSWDNWSVLTPHNRDSFTTIVRSVFGPASESQPYIEDYAKVVFKKRHPWGISEKQAEPQPQVNAQAWTEADVERLVPIYLGGAHHAESGNMGGYSVHDGISAVLAEIAKPSDESAALREQVVRLEKDLVHEKNLHIMLQDVESLSNSIIERLQKELTTLRSQPIAWNAEQVYEVLQKYDVWSFGLWVNMGKQWKDKFTAALAEALGPQAEPAKPKPDAECVVVGNFQDCNRFFPLFVRGKHEVIPDVTEPYSIYHAVLYKLPYDASDDAPSPQPAPELSDEEIGRKLRDESAKLTFRNTTTYAKDCTELGSYARTLLAQPQQRRELTREKLWEIWNTTGSERPQCTLTNPFGTYEQSAEAIMRAAITAATAQGRS